MNNKNQYFFISEEYPIFDNDNNLANYTTGEIKIDYQIKIYNKYSNKKDSQKILELIFSGSKIFIWRNIDSSQIEVKNLKSLHSISIKDDMLLLYWSSIDFISIYTRYNDNEVLLNKFIRYLVNYV